MRKGHGPRISGRHMPAELWVLTIQSRHYLQKLYIAYRSDMGCVTAYVDGGLFSVV